ncbi:MAG: phosphate ABC transporter ATP-binding protein [Nitrospinae bacterium]|nr:phosphate ABC transporter ATP-binding protein [Nitrospinota bacterium]
MNDTKPAIEIRDARVSFHGKTVLEKIDCEFHPRSATAVIGSSGSGKTTLLRTIARMNDGMDGFRFRGKAFVQGSDIYGNGTDVCSLRRKVGMVFQKPCVFPKSVFENAVFGLKHHQPERKKEFPELAERFLREAFLWDEVKDRLHQPAAVLSQGQQQRLAIARALAVGPEIFLMDEPTASLDPKSTQAIEELVRSLKEKHCVVLATHNLGQARRLCEEVLFVSDGRIRESGPAGRVFDNPLDEEARAYLSQ